MGRRRLPRDLRAGRTLARMRALHHMPAAVSGALKRGEAADSVRYWDELLTDLAVDNGGTRTWQLVSEGAVLTLPGPARGCDAP